MGARIIRISDQTVEFAASEAIAVLKKGGVLGYPTETVYGLGCNALNSKAVMRIRRLKGREHGKPFLILVKDAAAVQPLVTDVPETAIDLMGRFWPGPLTLIFPASPILPEALLAGSGKIGIRVSPDPFCRSLLTLLDGPLVSTRANRSGEAAARSAADLSTTFPADLDLIIDGGAREAGTSSTVLDVTEDPPKILRHGAIDPHLIQRITG